MIARSSLLAAAVLGLAAPAMAQTAPGFEPVHAAAPAALRALPAEARQLQFDGERASRTLSVFLTEDEARTGGELVLALQSGVSVMPEASSLSVAVNGRQAATLPLGGAERAPVAVALAAQLLHPGWNRLTLLASQRHRVDCRPDATFDLWTRIAPETSGLRFAGAVPPQGLGGLPTLRRAADGTLPIRIRLDGQNDDELAAGFTLAAAAARAAGGGAVRVDAAAAPLAGAGVEILAGSASRLAHMGVPLEIAALAGEGTPQWIAAAAGGGSGASARLVVVAVTPEERAAALARFAEQAPEPPPPAAALDGRSVSFEELGVATEEFSGRLFRQEMTLSLPENSLIADYGRVSLLLEAAYAADLERGAGLSVFVNDRLAATLPFGRTGGEEFRRRQIEMPLSAFRPGVNRIAVEARLPDSTDASCRPQDQINGRPRFLLLGESRLAVPPLAHMARLPDLASTVAAGSALAGLDPAMRIAVAASDADTISAAAAFYAGNALAAGRVPPLELGSPDLRELRSQVVVGAARDIGEAMLAEAGLDAPAILAAADERNTNKTAALKLDRLTTGSILASGKAAPVAGASQSALQNWRTRTRKDDGVGFAPGMLSIAEANAREVLGLAKPTELPPFETVALAVTQAMGANRQGPLTIVTALTPRDLAEGMNQLSRPEGWNRLSGQSLILDRENKFTVIPAQAVRFVPVEEGWSPANMRLVTAAWFSLNPLNYALIVLAFAILFGALSYAMVRRSGVRA